MSGTDHRDNTRVPVALRIKLRFRNLDTFISKFATNISATGMFISSRKPRESGTQLRFELRLADDSTVIAGKGRVVWVRDYDPDHPKEPHGMGIEFVSLSRGSRELIEKIVQQRVHQGLGETENIPHALDEQADALPPLALDALETIDEQPAKVLQPGAPGGGRELSLDDLESAQIDLGAVLRRARELVGKGSADGELDDLFRVSAAPIAETVDDASNKLAQMLGGNAVRGKRTRHRDPPTDLAALANLSDDEPTPGPPLHDDEQGDAPSGSVSASEPELSALDLIEDDVMKDDPAPREPRSARLRSEDDIPTAVATATLPASPEQAVRAEIDVALQIIEDDAGDFRAPAAEQPTAINHGLSKILALDAALAALDSAATPPPQDTPPALNDTLASLESDAPHEFRVRAETDESPIVISDESIDMPADQTSVGLESDEIVELDMLEDEDADFARRHSVTSVPSGIDVGVLDPGGLEDNGVYELSKPGTGPIDLLKLADLPSARPLDDEEYDSEIELDLPD